MQAKVTRSQVFGDGWGVAGQVLTLTSKVAPHTHDFVELVVILDGALTHVSRGDAALLGPGDVRCLRPGSAHALEVHDAVTVGNVYLAPELLTRQLAWLTTLGPTPLLLSGGAGRVAEPASVRRPLERLAASDADPLRRVGHLACVLAEIRGSRSRGRGDWEARVAALLADVTQDLSADWTVAGLAQRLHLSPAHFRRVFVTVVGRTPAQWLAESRVEAMAVTLASTDLPVHLAARGVGWDDANYASRRFRQLRGLAPSAYRRRYRFVT